ncbi:MAG: hypothetical protein WCJ62_01880 [Flavobacterium sp.]
MQNASIKEKNANTIKPPSIGKPGGGGGIGGGGLLDAIDELQHKIPIINSAILTRLIFIGRKSKKKKSA